MAEPASTHDAGLADSTAATSPANESIKADQVLCVGPTDLDSTRIAAAKSDAITEAQGSPGSCLSGSSRRSATPEPGKKRRKIDPTQQMQTLYDFMRRYRREDGSDLCETFIRAPKRRTDPSYYDVVSDPIDMLRIQQKLKTEEYADIEELKADFKKMFANAFAYYKKGSDEYRDASEMNDLFSKAIAKINAGEDPAATLGTREESEETELNDQLEDLFGTVMLATDPSDPSRALNLVFRLLPSQKRYPEYYQVISSPLDLKQIATKIVDNQYQSLSELEEDLHLMCRNAMTFNEPGSQIYRDARHILKLVKTKRHELEANKAGRDVRGFRSTRRGPTTKKHFAAEISSLQYEESESDEGSSEDDEMMDTDDPSWILYNTIRYYKTTSGSLIAEPFLALPSKRELPDYYVTISEPVSLNIIRKKLKNDEYLDFRAVYEDLNLMFENCKTYNRPDSRLYKDACRLQKVLKLKLDEVEAGSDEDEGMEDEEEDGGGGDDDEDDDEDEDADAKADEVVRISGAKGRKSLIVPEKRMMRELYNTLLKYRSSDGVQLITMFMEKPSKRDYPDYYEVIQKPMDMRTINDKLKNGTYKSMDDCINDFKLMFANCRRYNEEGSDIYEDANTLEKVLLSKARELNQAAGNLTKGGLQDGAGGSTGLRRSGKKEKNLLDRLKTLFETLREYKDAKGRQLSLIFLRLPNAKEFPDYYEVIKRPIDFEKIGAKLKQGYASLDACLADFVLMFDNACKYNEPDSQIYKDALTLQSLAHKTFRILSAEDEDANSVPDVNACVQDILNHIFTSMYNHQDSEERCYSDCLAELPEYDDVNGSKVRALNLDVIKRRLDRGLYRRLDLFQRDIFAVLDRARKLSRTDSQVFEDSVELQSYFIKVRDEACDHGEILQSRALLYTQSDLMRSVEELKNQKQLSEQPEEDGSGDSKMGLSDNADSSVATVNQEQYRHGDFVYVDILEKGMKPAIFLIDNIHTKEGQQVLNGNKFFRPVETCHVPSRKFLEQELFSSDVRSTVPINKIVGRCCVLSVKDYLRNRPEGYYDKDVFVCESHYSSKSRSFKKMKQVLAVASHIKLVPREQPLEPKRVQAGLKERAESHAEELDELEAMEKVVEEDLPPNVIWENTESNAEENCVYYEQYTIPGPITLRRGDAVYVRAENGKNLIAQIDTMWLAADGMAYFHGPWFVTPKEVQQAQMSQLFYRQEAMISTIQDTNPLLSVVGKCCILEMDDYVKSRPTQYDESNVFVCEHVYDESRRMVRPLPQTGLKGYEYQSTAVVADEVFYFRHAIHPHKESLHTLIQQSSQQQARLSMSNFDVDNEDSLDAPPSVGSSDTPINSASQRKVAKSVGKAKSVTPYIVFASEIRRSITEQNKMRSFGEISRIVGDKWRTLLDSDKAIYEEKAKKLNEENAMKHAEEVRLREESRKQEALNRAMQSHQMNSSATNAMSPQGHASSMPLSPAPHGGPQRPPSQSSAMIKSTEPLFHTVPPRPQRLLHSEAYIKYIEGLTADNQTMCNWDRQLNVSKDQAKVVDEAKLPAHWLADLGEHSTSLDALWALRDFLTCDSLGVTKLVG